MLNHNFSAQVTFRIMTVQSEDSSIFRLNWQIIMLSSARLEIMLIYNLVTSLQIFGGYLN